MEKKVKQSRLISNRSRRRSLKVADRLAQIASELTDDFSRRAINTAANAIRRHHGYSDEQKREEVLESIRSGFATVGDIQTDTGFTNDDIRRFVRELERSGDVVTKKMALTGNRGRPANCIFPKKSLYNTR